MSLGRRVTTVIAIVDNLSIYVVGNPLSVREISGEVLDIVPRLDQVQYGDHVLLIYPNMDSIREIYSHYSRTALENGESVLLLPYYETADSTRQTMKEIGVDVETHENEGRLMIVEDITKSYFGYGEDFLSFIDVLDGQNEKFGKKSITAIADMGIFYHLNNKDDLIRFEKSMPVKFGINLRRFCCYHICDYNRLEEREKHDLLEHHYLRVMMSSSQN